VNDSKLPSLTANPLHFFFMLNRTAMIWHTSQVIWFVPRCAALAQSKPLNTSSLSRCSKYIDELLNKQQTTKYTTASHLIYGAKMVATKAHQNETLVWLAKSPWTTSMASRKGD
jgi:hypothetical protein